MTTRTITTDGVWTWFHDPRAVHHLGVTYAGWSRADGIYVGSYDHATGATQEFQLSGTFPDDHNVPSVLIRPDGRILACYSEHNFPMRARISTNPLDVTAWGTEFTIDAGDCTYPSLVYLSSEDRIYLFYRLGAGGDPDRSPRMRTSDDWGETWSGTTDIFDGPVNQRPYTKYGTNGVDRIDVLCTQAHPDAIPTSVYHFYYQSGTWRRSDGTAVTLPATTATATLVYDGSSVPAWVWDIVTTPAGPVAAFTRLISENDHRYQYARWTGSSWATHEVVPAGGTIYEVGGAQPSYSGGVVLSRTDPATAYLSRPVDGTWQLERWHTIDGGATWAAQLLYTNSVYPTKNIRPVVPLGGGFEVVWLQGSYITFENFSTAVVGFVAEVAPVVPGALARTLSGSHQAVFDARVLTVFQTGDNPDGIAIPILGGDVQMDGTAEVQRTLELTTSGIDENTGHSWFPRHPGDLLAPYGNEVFVRRGVDLGSQVLWFPLGYFRITAIEQDDAPYGPIRLSGQDRMAGLIAARPLAPREFAATRSVASVFAELIGEVYPDAVIVFDDSAAATIGRTVVVEESRYDPLLEITTSLGKIMYWDGAGFLQVRTAPDEATPVWEIRAGVNGVMLRTGRRITDEGVYNGVVATGEAGESETAPARGVAVDLGPTSPTRWGGRFGKRPRFYSSPFLRSDAQATNAAREILRRSLGAPYSVDFGSVVNPALTPFEPVRVVQQDGNRDVHVLERLAIPLTADAAMSGSTRDKTLVVIGGLPT